MDLIKELTKSQLKEMPAVQVGDTVKVHVKVKEGARERIQVYEGIVIAKKHGGIEETITVRRVSYGIGVTAWCAAPSCTTCATAWARPQRSARSSDNAKKSPAGVLRCRTFFNRFVCNRAGKSIPGRKTSCNILLPNRKAGSNSCHALRLPQLATVGGSRQSDFSPKIGASFCDKWRKYTSILTSLMERLKIGVPAGPENRTCRVK